MLAGSPPSAIATGIVSPRSAITRQCAAPTLCRCQCIANVFLLNTCTRYIPTFLTPDSGFLVMTPPRVIYGPPSSGQQIGTGKCLRSTSESLRTVLWEAGRPTVLGGNFATSASRGSIASLPSNPSGTFIASSSAMRAPTWSRHSTPSASDMRFSEPNRCTATGYRDRPPLARVGCVNSSAGPPPGDFIQRSATSVISLSTDTGRVTCVRSPDLSIAVTNSRRLSSAMVDGADAAGQALESHARKPRRHHALRQRLGFRKREHRLWQVGIGVSMFRHEPADGGENPAKIEEIDRAQRRESGRGKFKDHEARSRLQHACRFAQSPVEVGNVAYAESHQGAVEPRRGKRQRQHVGGDGNGPRRLILTALEHRDHEVRADHTAAKPVAARQLGGEIECARAEVEIGAVGFRFPAESRDGGAAPGPIHVEAEQVVQEVVARCDRGEHVTDVGCGATHRRER